ncbi:MAG: TonB family protein, partial [Bacteroidetes bacterium]|nr:TonB family protein [Bacteroidota bacterium]
MDTAKILNSDFLDILFENRNKEYGAYDLRRQYNKRVRNALIGSAALMLLVIVGYAINTAIMKAERDNPNKPVIETIKMEDVKIPDDPKTPPPPPP